MGGRLLNDIANIVMPDTLLAWHRKLVSEVCHRQASTWAATHRQELKDLVVCLAQDNRDWGYRGILGAMSNLGHSFARGTIANILKKHDLELVAERIRKTTWKALLSQHWELIVAADFFTVEVWSRRGLQRCIVLFFIELSTRRVEVSRERNAGEWSLDEPNRTQYQR